MQFSTLLVATLSALASAAPRPQVPVPLPPAAVPSCQYPFSYDVSQFRPMIRQVYSFDGKLVNNEVSSNIITVQKLPLLQPNQSVTIKFVANNAYEFIPSFVTFSGDDNSTSTQNVSVYPVHPENLKGENLMVNVNAELVNYPCQPQVDAGSFVSPVVVTAIM